ncbi:hypothetical protein [Nesterenkonia pannonica]|uniref:hypothetical protein n=1 Tax=Nesterenkonia pannonica TaxID=1548602 RepID=UPI0021649619|nr:hypothetical protein [Nesterenkonia pannonica]
MDLDALPAAAPILVRGMGLNFFDLMIAVTVGRGGRFRTRPGAAPGQQLEYIASGRSRASSPVRGEEPHTGPRPRPRDFCLRARR